MLPHRMETSAPGRPRGPYHRSKGTRQRIESALRLRPGQTASEVARATGLAWGTVAHHLKGMVARGQADREDAGGRASYYLKPGA